MTTRDDDYLNENEECKSHIPSGLDVDTDDYEENLKLVDPKDDGDELTELEFGEN